jgi:hypothetical protein
MRIFAIVLNSEEKDEKFEILSTDFIPEENSLIVIKTGDRLVRASVVKVENVWERVGDSADIIFNVFVKILPPEEGMN